MRLRPLTAAALVACAGAAHAGWTITEVGVLPVGQPLAISVATAINDLGQVVGASGVSSTDNHAFLWTAGGGMTDLGDVPGGYSSSWATGINNAGVVTGSSTFGYTLEAQHAFVWTAAGGMVDLGAKPSNSYYSQGWGLNADGDIVGSTGYGSSWSAFVRRHGQSTLTLLAKPGGASARAAAIADSGLIAGEINRSTGITHAALWRDGSYTDLGDLPGGSDYSTAFAVNDAGLVVGASAVADGSRAFAWTAQGGMVALPLLPGGSSAAMALGLNEAGDIVGVALNAQGENRAVLWREGALIDLNALPGVAAAGWVLNDANGINERGQIVGTGTLNGALRGWVLTPVSEVPEPATWALLLAGGVLLASRRRAPAA
jgi:probable HAF family extracellular repeat protein